MIVSEEVSQEEQQPGQSQQCIKNLAQSSNDEEEDEGTAGIPCKIFKIPWIELTEKCGYWVQSDICNEYIYPEGYEKRGISADDEFFCSFFATVKMYNN